MQNSYSSTASAIPTAAPLVLGSTLTTLPRQAILTWRGCIFDVRSITSSRDPHSGVKSE